MIRLDQPDQMFADPRPAGERFAFDAHVASVFKDMINRSVPGYQTALGMLGVFASQYARPNSVLYDLGCSLGASTLMLRKQVRHGDCRIIAVDNAPAMIERCRANLTADTTPVEVDLICADIRQLDYANASLVALNFTLQFLPVEDRLPLLSRLHDSLLPGGALILAEKIAYPQNDENAWNIALHHEFKKANGYSDMEVAQKRSALENVLTPETLQTHTERLQQAGFSEIHNWFHCLNFAGLVAIRT